MQKKDEKSREVPRVELSAAGESCAGEEQERDMRVQHAEKLHQRNGRNMAEVRVIQRNVVHVIGLTVNVVCIPSALPNASELRRRRRS